MTLGQQRAIIARFIGRLLVGCRASSPSVITCKESLRIASITKTTMTQSAQASPETLSIDDELEAFGRDDTDLHVERTRLLFNGLRLPLLLMLLASLLVPALLWDEHSRLELSLWTLCTLALALVRLQQGVAFVRADVAVQARPLWLQGLLLGNVLSAVLLGYAMVVLVPAEGFLAQTLLYGLLGSVVVAGSVACGVSLWAFLSFTLPCLLPVGLLLVASEQPIQRGWGALGLIMLIALGMIAWQINRLVTLSLKQRADNALLIQRVTAASDKAVELNADLAREVSQRRLAERQLRDALDGLELRVAERTVELAKAVEALSQSEARLSLALEASELGLWDWDLQHDEVHHSGLSIVIDQSGLPAGQDDYRWHSVDPVDVPRVREIMVAHLKGETETYKVEYRVQRDDGSHLWIEDRGRVIQRDKDGRALRMIGTRRDISEARRQAEQQRLAAVVFEAASEGVAIMDVGYRLLAVNDACCELSGYSREELVGHSVARLASSTDSKQQYSAMREALRRDGSWQGELIEARKNGETYPQWVQLRAVRDANGAISNVVAFISDLTLRRQVEDRLRYLSRYDELTGLANRSLLKERLHDACLRARGATEHLAVLYIDLDRFKVLNDSLGHEAADQLLSEISRRLVYSLTGADTIARLSGDEFVVLLEGYGSLSSLAHVGSRLLGRIRKPMTIAGQELVVSASIGVSLLPDNAREPATLLAQANMAMQHAKHLGGNTLQFFTERLQASGLENLKLENQLRQALEKGQLEVFYQPRLSLQADRLDAAEALVRWHHPEQGLLTPAHFIALAEETGLIVALGEFVLRQACWQARQWQLDGLASIRVSVNLSAKQLRQGNLVSLVRQTLEETGLPAAMLELELTESQLLDDVENAISICKQLRALGVKLAIDDFGTGYSSLSYLKRFPVDYVKIDKTFISELDHSSEDKAIIRAIIAMVHGLELEVVAEGVETQAQMDFLKEQRCDEIQGYLISRPVPAAQFAQLLG